MDTTFSHIISVAPSLVTSLPLPTESFPVCMETAGTRILTPRPSSPYSILTVTLDRKCDVSLVLTRAATDRAKQFHYGVITILTVTTDRKCDVSLVLTRAATDRAKQFHYGVIITILTVTLDRKCDVSLVLTRAATDRAHVSC
jgi:hypothetical protein